MEKASNIQFFGNALLVNLDYLKKAGIYIDFPKLNLRNCTLHMESGTFIITSDNVESIRTIKVLIDDFKNKVLIHEQYRKKSNHSVIGITTDGKQEQVYTVSQRDFITEFFFEEGNLVRMVSGRINQNARETTIGDILNRSIVHFETIEDLKNSIKLNEAKAYPRIIFKEKIYRVKDGTWPSTGMLEAEEIVLSKEKQNIKR